MNNIITILMLVIQQCHYRYPDKIPALLNLCLFATFHPISPSPVFSSAPLLAYHSLRVRLIVALHMSNTNILIHHPPRQLYFQPVFFQTFIFTVLGSFSQ